MSRLEKTKREKRERRRYIGVLFLAVIMSIFGILSVDISNSYLMKDKHGISILNLSRNGSDSIQIKVLGNDFFLNTKYIYRDYERLKWFVKKDLTSKVKQRFGMK